MSHGFTLPVSPIAIVGIEEQLAWTDGAMLSKLLVKRDSEGFLVVLSAVVDGKHVVHFTGGRTYADALEVLAWEIEHNQLNWKPDRYAR